MIIFITSLLMTIKDVKDELLENYSSAFLVSSDIELKQKLKELNVSLSKITFINSNKKVRDWSKVLGVVKNGDKTFAYSENIKDELDANIFLTN